MMAKQKKLKNVKINEEELTPTVIGYLNEKKSSPFFLIILFAILFAFLYFVPDIDVYVNKMLGKDVADNGYVPYVKKEFNQNDAGKKFEFAKSTEINIKEITLTDFVIDNNMLSFTLKNNDTNLVDFGAYEYYLYLKGEDGSTTDIISMDDLIVYESNSKSVSYDLSGSLDVKNIIIDSFKDEYLNEIELLNNTLTCSLREYTYIYSFDNNKLVNVSYKYDVEAASNSLIDKYNKLKDTYSTYDGVTVLLDAKTQMHYTLNVDLSIADVSLLNDEKLFNKDVLAKKIDYKMSVEGYSCN